MEKSKEPEKEKGSKDDIHGTSSQLASDRKTSRQPGFLFHALADCPM